MHLHLHLVRAVAQREPKLPLRPAKVVQLDARREARLEAARGEQARPRPAA